IHDTTRGTQGTDTDERGVDYRQNRKTQIPNPKEIPNSKSQNAEAHRSCASHDNVALWDLVTLWVLFLGFIWAVCFGLLDFRIGAQSSRQYDRRSPTGWCRSRPQFRAR